MVNRCNSFLYMWCNNEDTEQNVKIVANQGVMEERPESTMAAFKRAHELGADIIEVDLCTSKVGYLFILHDSMLYRTIDGPSEHSHFVKKGYPVVNRNCSIIQGIT